MISSFNIEKLNGLLRDFYTVTRIRITVFNEHFEEITSYPKERAKICGLVRSTSTGLAMCSRCDKDACRVAAGEISCGKISKENKFSEKIFPEKTASEKVISEKFPSPKQNTYIYQCHAGLTEAITPIRMGNLLIGYLMFGHIFSYSDIAEGIHTIQEKCIPYGIEPEAIRQACLSCPTLSEEYILASSHLLHATASYLCLERMATLKYENLPVQIDRYIQEHLQEELTAARLCEHFHIGKTQLYKIAKESYGMGIAELIRNKRIEKAKKLLVDSPIVSLSEVAQQCGFTDYNYFIVVFKKQTGYSPRQFALSRAAEAYIL